MALGLLAGMLSAGISLAQSTGTGVQGTIEISPLPLPRTVPPEAPETPVSQPDQPSSVTVVTPETDAPVTIIFGQPRETPDADTEDADPDTTTDRWQAERAKRFQQVPESFRRKRVSVPNAIVPIRPPETTLNEAARVRQLDKMTGQTETYDVDVGQTVRVARLEVRLDACRAPEDGASHGTMAFLKIWDTKVPDADPVFSGWMFAESPALSALDHPRYDLWVIKCTTSAGETSAARQ